MPSTKTGFVGTGWWRRLFVATIVVAALTRGGVAAASRRVFVWFADGGPAPPSVREICFGSPPAFRCSFGTFDSCRKQIQAFLDRWYADFDVVFTYVPPNDGAPFDTIVVASEGAWCGADERTVSRSPLPACTAMPRGAVAVFRCDDAKLCATTMAKEHAHILGLQHTGSSTDVMYEIVGPDHDGFEDKLNRSGAPRCGGNQNSYRLMLERAGQWAGGPKPDPGLTPDPMAPEAPDASAPSEDAASGDAVDAEDAAGNGSTVDVPAGEDLGGPKPMPPPDAPVRDAGANPGGDDGGGCSCELVARRADRAPGVLAAFVLAFLGLGRTLGRRVRRRNVSGLIQDHQTRNGP
jgi:hypothetical protein